MFRHHAKLIALAALFAGGPTPSAAPVPTQSPAAVRKEFDPLWADLLSADERTATLAIVKMASRPNDAVWYLKEKLRPLKLSKERALRLVSDLASRDVKVAEAAFAELGYLDPRLALGDEELRSALLHPFVQRKLGAVLCDLPIDAMSHENWHWYSPGDKVYRFKSGEKIWDLDTPIGVALIGTVGRKASWARAIRAVAILEFIDTPKARAVLDDMATGHPAAAPTKAAMLARHRPAK